MLRTSIPQPEKIDYANQSVVVPGTKRPHQTGARFHSSLTARHFCFADHVHTQLTIKMVIIHLA
jgi:hypothetical protein